MRDTSKDIETGQNNVTPKATDSVSVGGITLPIEMFFPYLEPAIQAIITKLKSIISDITKKYENLREEHLNQGEENGSLRKQIKEKDNQIAELKAQQTTQTPAPQFNYFIDTRTFDVIDDEEGERLIRRFWDNLFDLFQETTDDGEYIINNMTCYVPILLVMQSPKFPYRFTGNRSDFVYALNKNIIKRLPRERREKMECKEKSLNSALSKSVLNGDNLSEWERKACEGGKYANVFERAAIIKKRMDGFRY